MKVSKLIEILSNRPDDEEIVALWWDKDTFLQIPDDDVEVTDEMLKIAHDEVIENIWIQERIWEQIWEVIIENQKESE